MLSPCYSSLGRACLLPLKQREYARSASSVDADLSESLEFIDFACVHLPAQRLPLLPTAGKGKVVVFTDAEGKKRKGRRAPTGHLGFVVVHPVHGTVHAHAPAPAELTALLDRVKQRDTYIGQYELAAAITPFISLPRSWFEGRPVELWIDNSGAIGALVSGYSGKPDCGRMVNFFHFALAKLGAASLWIDYVPSESNPADIPSRFHEMSAQERAGASDLVGRCVPIKVPQFATADGQWRSYVDIAASVWR